MNKYAGQVRRFLNRGFTPVTNWLILLNIVFFVGLNLTRLLGFNLFGLFQFSTSGFYLRPWTLLTYPLVNYAPLSLLFTLLWLWFVGGSLERSWGGQTYSFFLGLATIVTGLAFALVALFFGNLTLSGLWFTLTGVTWAWAKLYPDRELLFWGLFPIKAEWLAWIQAGLMFYRYLVGGNFFFALASISSIAVVYLFAGRGPFARGFRYWAWTHNFSPQRWWQDVRDRRRKRRFKVVE